MARPLILVTNDDGIESPGLHAVASAVVDLGELLVVAPTRQQTAMSRSFAGSREERFVECAYSVAGLDVKAFHCDVSPAFAVSHALDVLCRGRVPALVVSGINYGENLGLNTTLSGTVGAALQAASVGIPGLAMSVQTPIENHYDYGTLDWSAATHFAEVFARRILAGGLPPDVDVLKVDVPDTATAETPWRVTRVSRQSYYSFRISNPSPETRLRDKDIVIDLDHRALESDSDIYALAVDRVVSVSPLSLDLTSRVDLGDLSAALC